MCHARNNSLMYAMFYLFTLVESSPVYYYHLLATFWPFGINSFELLILYLLKGLKGNRKDNFFPENVVLLPVDTF